MRPLRAVSALAAVLACGAGAPAATIRAPHSDRALDRALRTLVTMEGGPPGVIALVQRRSQVRVHTAGTADVATQARSRATDHMRIASVAKAFSGAVALSLVQQSVLALDDTVGRWRPDLFTQFAAASADGSRSATVSINLQRTQESDGQAGKVFRALRRAETAAVCAALARR